MRLPRPTLLLALSTLSATALALSACGDKEATDGGADSGATDADGTDTDTDGTDTDGTDTDGTDTDGTDTDGTDTDGTDTDGTDTDGGTTDRDGDGYDESEDCDDNKASVNPGATEIWYDGVDQDCDGADDYDQDGDGEGARGYDAGGDDCDDTDATVRPGATDTVGDGIDQDCDGIDATTATRLSVDELSAGDLVITEIFANPEASAEESGEWVELYNATALDMDLDGLTLRDDDGDLVTLDRALGVAAGGTIVLGRSEDSSINGGVAVAYGWGTGLALGNGIDELELVASDVVIDRVVWDDGATFPDVAGASMSLDPSFYDAFDNDYGVLWCAGVDPFGAGDLGTPGADNPACPDVDATDADGDGYLAAFDCDDGDPDVYPGATDLPYDGVDADCMGDSDYDADGDGHDSETYGGDDCDDDDAAIHPGATDTDGDDIDSDCDGTDGPGGGDGGTDSGGTDSGGGDALSVDALVAGDLVITEVMQNPAAVGDDAGEWFEILNLRDEPVDLDGLVVSDADTDSHTIRGSVVVGPGEYVVLGNNTDTATNGGVDVAYDYGSTSLGNGADELILSNGAGVIDEIRWDGGPEWPDPTGASMTLDAALLNATDNDSGASWCEGASAFGSGDLGTPGAANPSCSPGGDDSGSTDSGSTDSGSTDSGSTDSGSTDSGSTDSGSSDSGSTDSGSTDSGSTDSGSSDSGSTDSGGDDALSVDDLVAGDLVITEVMQNPAAVGDDAGEWFEILNLRDAVVDLDGLIVADADGESHTISGSVLVGPGEYVVLGNNTDTATNGGVDVAYDFGSVSLGNGADELILSNGAGVIDEIRWDGGPDWPDPTGASMTLDAGLLNATDNDSGDSWCEGSDAFGSGDLGTPGAANPSCSSSGGDSGSSDSGSTDSGSSDSGSTDSGSTDSGSTDSGSTDSGSSDSGSSDSGSSDSGSSDALGIDEVGVGELVITEIMQNPDAVGDSAGEWFELYNATGSDVDLYGMVLSDAGSDSHTVSEHVIVSSPGVVVLGINSDSGTNGGANVAYQYSSFTLGNGDDEVILSNASGVIDAVYYDGGPDFPDPTGASMNLSSTAASATANDDGANWCTTSTDSTYGDGDRGTPDAINETCD
ncbi:MAG: lamin tail domain-containing protein [Alphaproteobacteria bacterium]|nr:lamin tail domain-containing protein [Alphaproteobacteria bacterium]